MATNEVFKPADHLSLVCTNPAVPAANDPVRYGFLTGVALTDEDAAGLTTVDLGLGVWTLSVIDTVGGGVALGDTLFYHDGAPGTIDNSPAGGFFYGFALQTIGAGLTVAIRVLHVPSPGSGTLGAGTIATANLAVGILSADAAGRAKMAAGYFDAATALSAFGAGAWTNAVLIDALAAGAFQADAATRAKFGAGIWTATEIANATLTGIKAAVVADANTTGGLPMLHRVNIAGGAAGDTDVVLDAAYKIRVLDVWAVHTGGAGEVADTIQVFNGALGAITDAMSWAGADQTIVRAATIDDAQHEILAAGTLRVTTTDADAGADVGAGVVYVLAARVA